jgi:hypothetical protein
VYVVYFSDPKKQKIEIPSGARDIRGFLNSPTAGPSNKAATATGNLSTSQPKLPTNNPVKGKAWTGFSGKNVSPPKGKAISGYFTTSTTSGKGKTVTGFAGSVKNKGSSTITVTSPSSGSTETSEPNDARPTQGGIVSKPPSMTSFIPFTGQGRLLGGGSPKVNTPWASVANPSTSSIKKETPKVVEIVSLDADDSPEDEKKVPCPICQSLIGLSQINAHLDSCLS